MKSIVTITNPSTDGTEAGVVAITTDTTVTPETVLADYVEDRRPRHHRRPDHRLRCRLRSRVVIHRGR